METNLLPNQIVVEGILYDIMEDSLLNEFKLNPKQHVAYLQVKVNKGFSGNIDDYRKKILKFQNNDPDQLIFEVLDWLIDSNIIKNLTPEQDCFVNEFFPNREFHYRINDISKKYANFVCHENLEASDFVKNEADSLGMTEEMLLSKLYDSKYYHSTLYSCISAMYCELLYQDPEKAIHYIDNMAQTLNITEEAILSNINEPDYFYDEELMKSLATKNAGMIKIVKRLLKNERDEQYKYLSDCSAIAQIPLTEINDYFENFTTYILTTISNTFSLKVKESWETLNINNRKLIIHLFFGEEGFDLYPEYKGEEIYRDAFIGLKILHKVLPESDFLKWVLKENGTSIVGNMVKELDFSKAESYFEIEKVFEKLNITSEDLIALFLFYTFENINNPSSISEDEGDLYYFWSEFVSDGDEKDIYEVPWYKNNRNKIKNFGISVPSKDNLPNWYFNG